MLIDVAYFAQAAAATGTSEESFEADELGGLLREIAARHGDAITELICDGSGTLVPWVLVDINGTLVRDQSHALAKGDRVRFISPISGG